MRAGGPPNFGDNGVWVGHQQMCPREGGWTINSCPLESEGFYVLQYRRRN